MKPMPTFPQPAHHYHSLWGELEAKVATLLSITQHQQAADPRILDKASKTLRSIHATKRRLARLIRRAKNQKQETQVRRECPQESHIV